MGMSASACACIMGRSGTNAMGGIGSTGGGQSHDHTLSANFVGSSTSILQPYLVLIYIIKT